MTDDQKEQAAVAFNAAKEKGTELAATAVATATPVVLDAVDAVKGKIAKFRRNHGI